MAHGAFAFKLLFRLRGESCPRYRLQSFLPDWLSRRLTNSVSAAANSIERLFDFIERALLARQHGERPIAIVAVRAGIGHVQAVGGRFFRSFVFQHSAFA